MVISDGEKFGNVLSCTAVASANGDNPMDPEDEDLMMMTPFSFGSQAKVADGNSESVKDDKDQEREEESKIEYNSQLLLGDRGLNDWLSLFSQQLLKTLSTEINTPLFKGVKSMLLTTTVPPKLKLAGKKDQFCVMKDLNKLIKEAILLAS